MLLSKDYPSKTNPDKPPYTVMVADNGLISCKCPGWINKRDGQDRHCRHTDLFIKEFSLTVEVRDEQQFATNAGKAKPVPVLTRTDRLLAETTAASFLQPMLASPMPEGWDADHYPAVSHVMEEKFDGHRILTLVKAGKLKSWARSEKGRTLPTHILNIMAELPDGLYDGELIVPGKHSYDVTAGINTGTEVMILFDLLSALGQSTTSFIFEMRRQLLETAFQAIKRKRTTAVRLAKQQAPSMKEVKLIWKRGGEGAVIKRLASLYHPGGRTDDWIKVKVSAAATLVITGYEPGKVGPYSAVQVRDAKGIETTVKTLNNVTMRAMEKNPKSFIGRSLVISYQERTPNGKYRHPMWDHLVEGK